MTRTTINLDPTVLSALRERAEREGKSMGTVTSELLSRALASRTGGEGSPFTLQTFAMGTPKVDLEDPEALRRALDRPQ